jgi:hypothetical protein
MSNNILFIFEGQREKSFAKSLQKHVFKDKLVIHGLFGAEVYQLYKQISDDSDLDIISLLKERDSSIADYSRVDFSEIYLFFDYDAHASLIDRDGDNELLKMLSLFDNETENGKLYISYPMVEALWHISDFDTFHNVVVKCKGQNCSYRTTSIECEECDKEPNYKTVVSKERLPLFNNVRSYDRNDWCELIRAHLCKMNYVCRESSNFPESVIEQQDIFDSQLRKHINKRCPEVAVLSAFPIFVHDYYGNEKTRKMLSITK